MIIPISIPIAQFSDLIREYFLSEIGNSCVGLLRSDNEIEPMFAESEVPFVERFAGNQILAGACRFVKDYVDAFGELCINMPFDPVQVSMPFEGLIHMSRLEDRRVFAASASDDTVYGQSDNINMSNFWMAQINRTGTDSQGIIVSDYYSCVQTVAYGKGKVAKTIIYAICDRKTLKEKLKIKLERYPVILFVLRKTYKMAKSLRNIFKHK